MTYAIFQTIMVYGLLTIIMFILFKESYRQKKNSYTIYALLIYSVIFGLRYCVGVDYMSYVVMYEKVASGIDVEKEFGFVGLMKFFSALGLGIEWFFAFCAFFQLFFIFQLFKSQKDILPYLILTFMMSGEMVNYSNIIRNMFAFAIVVYSLKYIQNKSPLKHYFWLFVAFSIHKSCAIMVVLYPLYMLKSEYFKNRLMQYGLLVVSLVLMNLNYIQEFIAQTDSLMALLGYNEKYILDDRMDQKVSIGLGFIIELAIACTIVYYSPKAKEHYAKLPINIMYDLFVVGLVIKYSFIGSLFIQRMNTYFIGYTFILAAMEYACMRKTKIVKGRYILLGLYCMLAFSILYRMVENSAMFIFDFQDDLFYLKNEFRAKEL